MARKRSRTQVFGPYKHRKRWRLKLRAPGGEESLESFDTEAEAEAAKRGIEAALLTDDAWERAAELEERAREAAAVAEATGGEQRTVEEVLEQYLTWCEQVKGNKTRSVDTTRHRLRGLLRPLLGTIAKGLTRQRVADVYAARARAVAVDTHRNELNQTKTMWRWAAQRGLVRPGLWDSIEPQGKRRRGKPQPRRTEARALYEAALAEASSPGDDRRWARARQEGALGVLVALLLGYRASEIVSLQPRDVDDGWAWVEEGKTEAAARHTEIPEPLRALLHQRAAEVRAQGGDRLFPHDRSWVLQNVKRLCRLAGIPPVTAHGLRGLHATLATRAGATGALVAAQLGHESETVTKRHYTAPEAVTGAAQGRVLEALRGPSVRTCRVCGCTDEDCRQCIEATGQPCYWVEADLCSRCIVGSE